VEERERDRGDELVEREAAAAAAEAGSIGGRAGDPDDPDRAVREGGGGEAEGFEEAEAELVDRAEHGEGADPAAQRHVEPAEAALADEGGEADAARSPDRPDQ
jgi:hypothetical protein